MRPQIRSLPLCQVECPQFSWAVRNNSDNVAIALQPDLQNQQQDEEETDDKDVCYCLERGFKPTLFPHPVSCVCTDEPCAPTNEKYRFCKLKMDQSIGDMMEETFLENLPPPSKPAPFCKEDKVIKKIMRSAFIPEEVDLTADNACMQCLAKDANLFRELMDSFKKRSERTIDRKLDKPGDQRSLPNKGGGLDCFAEDILAESQATIDQGCKWKKDVIKCTCKQQKHDVCKNCNRCRCNCGQSCLKCTCEKASPRNKKGVTIKGDKKKKGKKGKVKSPKKAGGKSPGKKSKKKGNDIICERFEFVESNSLYQNDDKQSEDREDISSPIQIYEHFSVKEIRSGSSKSVPEAPVVQKVSNDSKSLATKSSSGSKKSKSKPKKPVRVPWNWNNQPKVEDPIKTWGGTKYSWSKRFNLTKLDKKLEENDNNNNDDNNDNANDNNNDNMVRSRGGYDMLRSEVGEPSYFEYKPNLRPIKYETTVVEDDEEEIKYKEQRRYRNGYGRMRVKSWHQALSENASSEADKAENMKEKSEFSEEDLTLEEENEGTSDDHDNKQCFHCLMSDVQHQFHGSTKKLCTHEKNGESLDNTQTMISTFEDEDNPIDPAGRLPTIIEEIPEKQDESALEMGKTYRIDEYKIPGKAKTRPKTVEPPEVPFFNVIKQRIHSRNKTLEDLNQLRNDVSNEKTENEHTCVHRFTVDDRLFPKPLHCDQSGTSCCVYCDKPMTSSEKSVFLDQRDSKEKLAKESNSSVQKQVSKFSLKPKPVHMGAKKSVMEIRLKPEHSDLLNRNNGDDKNGKKEFYPDSLALRHQRK
ncbi:uncharacterized protein LOC123674778 [Harmonia axyridis]|uniref:uncharacterized protein LOC123674778 n=1 Tax=Harmonia axyridis TaxID=115357 RepID=UPI001E27503B|nr:uncharacterized protein LOC123674778 [Harmonia axyridis]